MARNKSRQGKNKGKNDAPRPLRSPAKVAEDLRVGIRAIVYQWKILREPLLADPVDTPRPDGMPNRLRGAQQFEELKERVSRFAGRVWQIKDGLIKWLEHHPTFTIEHQDGKGSTVKGKGGKHAERTIEDIAKTSMPLMLAADLYNSYKHYDDCNRSGYAPILDGAEFDTSKAGTLGIYYDGSRKSGDLLVTNRVPVPIRVEIKSSNQPVDFGEGVRVIARGFLVWVPLIRQIRLLSPNIPEDRAILDDLAAMEAEIKAEPPFKPGADAFDAANLTDAEWQLAHKDPAAFVAAIQAKLQPPPEQTT